VPASNGLKYCKIVTKQKCDIIQYNLRINEDFTWTVMYYEKILDPSNIAALRGLPASLNAGD